MKDVGTWTPSRRQKSMLDIDITANHASMDVNVLPWQQFSMPMEHHHLSAAAAPKDYAVMLDELNVTHAVMAASSFEPMDFAEAEQLVQVSSSL